MVATKFSSYFSDDGRPETTHTCAKSYAIQQCFNIYSIGFKEEGK
jgi:hypothetical protein